MKTTHLIALLFFTSQFFGPLPLHAENSNTEKKEDKAAELVQVCQKPIKTRGPGDTLSKVAKLKTIILWSEKVTQKHGEDFAQWHKAKSKKVKCNKKEGSSYYYCDLRAIPCTYKEKEQDVEQEAEQDEPKTKNKS